MADKYIIHGATYNGDGTTSSEAASNGAPGAWNTVAVMETVGQPTYGSIAAGDVIHIRSKTSAGADIVRTLAGATNLGSNQGSTSNPVVWCLDDGTIWSGVTGTLSYETAASQLTVLTGNRIVSRAKEKLIFKLTSHTFSVTTGVFVVNRGALVSNAKIDLSVRNTAGATGAGCSVRVDGVLDRPLCRFGRLGASSNNGAFTMGSFALIIDPDIELLYAPESGGGVFRPVLGGQYKVVGGRVWGAGATTGQEICVNTGHIVNFEIVGLQYPSTCTLADASAINIDAQYSAVGADSAFGGAMVVKGGYLDSRNDGYYPTLNATLPDSTATPWSWKMYPQFANQSTPVQVPIATVFSDTAATKTITLNMQIATAFTALNKGNLFMTMQYTDDATGETRYLSTLDPTGAALDSSTAGWSATTYGAVGLSKKKLSVTTPTAIKQNTPIVATLVCIRPSSSANDILFICPDLVLS